MSDPLSGTGPVPDPGSEGTTPSSSGSIAPSEGDPGIPSAAAADAPRPLHRRAWLRWCGRLLVYALVAWGLLRWLERRMTFLPMKEWQDELGRFSAAEEITFRTSDGVQLSGAWFPHPEQRAVLLYCHGNAGNISHRFESTELWRRLGFSVLLFDYRGYGRSEGRPSEEGLLRDVRAAYQRAVELGGQDPVVLGRSLGCVPAVVIAGEQPVRGLILDSPFASARSMAGVLLPIPGLGRLLSLRLDNLEAIQRVRCRVLVVHGTDDEIIPVDQGAKVFEAAPEPKRFVPLSGLRHNDSRDRPDMQAAIAQFLAALPPGDR